MPIHGVVDGNDENVVRRHEHPVNGHNLVDPAPNVLVAGARST